MGDRAVFAREGEPMGVYVHWAGELPQVLEQIIARDGVEKATETLLTHHWSNISTDAYDRALGHTELIDGYGNAYTDLDGADPLSLSVDDPTLPVYFICADGTVRGG